MPNAAQTIDWQARAEKAEWELERVQKQAAAMRVFLESEFMDRLAICHVAGTNYVSKEQHWDTVRKFATGICSAHREPDASCPTCNHNLSIAGLIEEHGKVWRGQVKPLVDALESYASCSDGCTCGDGWSHSSAVEALDHARTLGL